ncbi:histone H2B [Nematocida homosporus]|uniref:histone H2B n=1 Tax=Nematocida homosporus TaxID=1912981 RepID=UPI002220110E|nr:histone H2B [Nematocida homosporus]KAI5185150.1 histone H2B [Nematocida homosporus]
MRTADGKPAEKRPAGKAPAKGLGSSEKKKSKPSHAHKNHYNFRSSVKRMLKSTYQASPPQVSGPVVESLCNIVHDVIERLSLECATLARKVGKQTINLEEVTSAAQVNLTGELRTHALKEIKEAVAKVPTKASK